MPERPPSVPKKESGILKMVAVAGALHAAIGGAPKAAEVYKQHQQEVAKKEAAEQKEKDFDLRRLTLAFRGAKEVPVGRLPVGDFVIQANAIDAEQEGKPINEKEASEDYNKLRDAFIKALPENASMQEIQETLNEVLKEYNYEGVGGKSLGKLLLDRGGSCEQISHLVDSLLYDAGYHNVALRHYAGDETHAAHVAPVVDITARNEDGSTKVIEYDLTGGGPALTDRGVRQPFETLVTRYQNMITRGNDHGKQGFYPLYPTIPPELSRPFPGSVPLFHRGIVAYDSQIIETAVANNPNADHVSSSSIEVGKNKEEQKIFLKQTWESASRALASYSDHVITEPEQQSEDEVYLSSQKKLSSDDLQKISDEIIKLEQTRSISAQGEDADKQELHTLGLMIGLQQRLRDNFVLRDPEADVIKVIDEKINQEQEEGERLLPQFESVDTDELFSGDLLGISLINLSDKGARLVEKSITKWKRPYGGWTQALLIFPQTRRTGYELWKKLSLNDKIKIAQSLSSYNDTQFLGDDDLSRMARVVQSGYNHITRMIATYYPNGREFSLEEMTSQLNKHLEEACEKQNMHDPVFLQSLQKIMEGFLERKYERARRYSP